MKCCDIKVSPPLTNAKIIFKVVSMPTASPQRPYMAPVPGRNTKRLLNIVPIVREGHGMSNPRHQHVGISGSTGNIMLYVSGFSGLCFGQSLLGVGPVFQPIALGGS